MSILSKADIDERIALYLDYRDAMEMRDQAEARLPEDLPDGFTVTWADADVGDLAAIRRVLQQSWRELRAAVLNNAYLRVEGAERRVIEFEAGKEV